MQFSFCLNLKHSAYFFLLQDLGKPEPWNHRQLPAPLIVHPPPLQVKNINMPALLCVIAVENYIFCVWDFISHHHQHKPVDKALPSISPSVGPPTYDQATAPFLPSPADPFTWQDSAEAAAKSAIESLLGQGLAQQTKARVACSLSSGSPCLFVVVQSDLPLPSVGFLFFPVMTTQGRGRWIRWINTLIFFKAFAFIFDAKALKGLFVCAEYYFFAISQSICEFILS